MFIFQLIPPHFFPLKTILPENKSTFKEGKKTTSWGARGEDEENKGRTEDGSRSCHYVH